MGHMPTTQPTTDHSVSPTPQPTKGPTQLTDLSVNSPTRYLSTVPTLGPVTISQSSSPNSIDTDDPITVALMVCFVLVMAIMIIVVISLCFFCRRKQKQKAITTAELETQLTPRDEPSRSHEPRK